MNEAQPQLTVRAIVTGFLLGAALVPCNVYSGLKIGWSFNMSIAAALLSYGFWTSCHRVCGTRPWGLLENNINQTAASSSASIISAGLVAPIPALTLLTGQELAYPILVVWVLVVSFLGVVVAVGVRNQMLLREQLPFPNGIATAETIREMYAHGQEAAYRIRLLLSGGLLSGGLKLINDFWYRLPVFGFPGQLSIGSGGTPVTLRNLGFVLEPSLLMIGFGAIVGLRVGVSLLLGSVIAWLLLPRPLLDRGWVEFGEPDPSLFWYGELLEWLLWPGVALMVTASLTSFSISIARLIRKKLKERAEAVAQRLEDPDPLHQIPRSWFRVGLAVAFVATVVAQLWLFDVPVWLGVCAFLLTFVLAVVAARVSGETGIPPIGALGKVTQVSFGLLSPGNVTTNLMAANVTGGAAGQCSDLLHDLKTGLLIRATLRFQVVAQMFGILSGALFGSAAYLILITDPQAMLLTPEWPAPAVATWKAVAEVMAEGLHTLPAGCVRASVIAAGVGVLLGVMERMVSERNLKWVPSASSMGLAFVIPPSISMAMFIGALLAALVGRWAPDWRRKYVVVIAAGAVAGESLAGVANALWNMITGTN